MGISRAEAYAMLHEPAAELAAAWIRLGLEGLFDAQQPWNLMIERGINLRVGKVEAQIDLADPEWALEQSFDDVFDVLIWELADQAWEIVFNKLASDEASTGTDDPTNREISRVLADVLHAEKLISKERKLHWNEITLLAEAIGHVLGNEWIRRGGRRLPPRVLVSLLILGRYLGEAVDVSTGNSYDDEGLPERRRDAILKFSLPESFRNYATDTAYGKIALQSSGWSGFHISSCITKAITNVAPQVLSARKQVELNEQLALEQESASTSLPEWQRFHHRPLVSPFGLNPDEAEDWVRSWMLHMGARGAKTTQYVGDGGIDVEADNYIAQVKMYAGSVGIAALREFAGVAFTDLDGRQPLFFTTGRYPQAGPELANRARMALFHFDLATGEVTGSNELGQIYVKHGFLDPH